VRRASLLGLDGVLAGLVMFVTPQSAEANICSLPSSPLFAPAHQIDGRDFESIIVQYLYNEAFDVVSFSSGDRVVFGQFSAPDAFLAKLDEVRDDYLARRWSNGKHQPPNEDVPGIARWLFRDAVTFEGYVFDPPFGWLQEEFELDVPYSCGEEGYCDLGINLHRPSINMVHSYGGSNGAVAANVFGVCDSINGLDVVTQERVDMLHQCLLAERCPQ